MLFSFFNPPAVVLPKNDCVSVQAFSPGFNGRVHETRADRFSVECVPVRKPAVSRCVDPRLLFVRLQMRV